MALTRAILIDNLILIFVYIYFVYIGQKWALQVPPLLLDVSSRFSGEPPFLESNALFCVRVTCPHMLYSATCYRSYIIYYICLYIVCMLLWLLLLLPIASMYMCFFCLFLFTFFSIIIAIFTL